jgi:hypothetical protein
LRAPAATLLRWLLVLAVGTLVLAGRYDFSEARGRFALQAFAATAYFFWIVVPLTWAITRRLVSRRTAQLVTALVFTVACFPYRLVGLQRFRHAVAIWGAGTHRPEIIWWPRALFDPGAPGERALLLLLLAAVALLALLAHGWRWRRAAPLVAIVAALVVQTLLHTSLRSPYSYEAHFEAPGKWYHDYLVPDGKGAVNADIPLFTTLDEHFVGIPKPMSTFYLRRSFLHWIGAHASYFVTPYYVYLVVNVLLWLVAVVCTYHWVRRVVGDLERARLTAALVACGNGFIAFVAQPTSYLGYYTAMAALLWGFELFLVDEKERPWAGTLGFGALFGLACATYDIFPVVPSLLIYARLRRVRLLPTLAAMAMGLALHLGFVQLHLGVFRLVDKSNLHFSRAANANLVDFIATIGFATLYEHAARLVVVVAQDLVYAFTIVPALLALVALVLAERRVQTQIALWLLPVVLLAAYLFFGGIRWGRVSFAEIPRFFYLAYPAIYLATADLLARARAALLARGWRRTGAALPWAIVGLIAIVHNVDAFGYPGPYYHLLWPTPMLCDPYGNAVCPPV